MGILCNQYLKSKIKAAVSKPALASYAVEGTVAGTGGAATNVINQKIQQEVGLRDEEDGIDLTICLLYVNAILVTDLSARNLS